MDSPGVFPGCFLLRLQIGNTQHSIDVGAAAVTGHPQGHIEISNSACARPLPDTLTALHSEGIKPSALFGLALQQS